MTTLSRLVIGFWWIAGLVSAIISSQVAIGQTQDAKPNPVAGRFGTGWNAQDGGIYHDAVARWTGPPLTVEAWVKANDAKQEHVIVSNGLQMSGDHWELATRRDSGHLFALFQGIQPATIETECCLTDGRWHYVAMSWNERRVRLFVDDALVANVETRPVDRPVHPGEFALGMRADEKRLTDLILDDVRISGVARDLVAAPELPLTKDEATLQLWNFESSVEDYLARWTPGGETNQRNLPYPQRIAEFEYEDEPDWVDGRWQETDFGPFLSHSFLLPGHEMGAKLTAIRLPHQTTAIFDSRACTVTALVVDSEIRINPSRFGLLQKPSINGHVIAHLPARKSWMRAASDGGWKPLANDELDYRGLRLSGDTVVLDYTVANSIAEEFNASVEWSERTAVVRRLKLAPTTEPLLLTLTESQKTEPQEKSDRWVTVGKDGAGQSWYLGQSSTGNVALAVRESDVGVVIQPSNETTICEIVTTGLESGDSEEQLERVLAAAVPSWTDLNNSNPPRWGDPLVTRGKRAEDDGRSAYLLDELTIPFDNPFHALFFISAIDFFPNGDAAICTAHGDVWLVTGIDASLESIRWQRFATGLYQPLGIKIVDGKILVLGRDQLTQLDDVNGDGEADLYGSICHDLSTQGQDHAYAMRLESDSQGNLYFLKSSEGPPHGCSLLKLPKGSKRLEVVASGFRHPYGLGIGPHDEITVADNEGNWIPSSKIDLIQPGGFYGYFEHGNANAKDLRPLRPLCFIPKFIDNSCGGQPWVTSDRWGGYHVGEMMHLSWGRCTLHAVLRQQVGDVWQAATVKFPNIVFRSGSGAAKFHPLDGQLYVVGLDGWQTGAVQDGCLQRVRYSGRPVAMPDAFSVFANGIRIRYASELDATTHPEPRDFEVQHWNYLWSETYGSFHYRPSQPDAIGHDRLEVARVIRLDARTVFLEIAGLEPVDQIQVSARVRMADGQFAEHELVGTINALPAPLSVESQSRADDPLAREQLIAWCIVPFDAAKRNPRQRAEMLNQLGIKRLAYDWRDEHIASWDEEVKELRAQGIELAAFWAPVGSAEPLSEKHWPLIWELIDRHQLKMQLWVMLDERLLAAGDENAKIDKAVGILQPLASEAAKRGCQIGLYNHGGWFGTPDNLARVAAKLRGAGLGNVGIVFNFHHAHDYIDSFDRSVAAMKDFLICVNLNGMRAGGPKILPIGAGESEANMIAELRQVGFTGPFGILGHREELDARDSLQQNLDGLERLSREPAKQVVENPHPREVQVTKDEQRVLELVNNAREASGIARLTMNEKLMQAARGHAENMAKQNSFEHTLDGQDFWRRIEDQGYVPQAAAENIGQGARTPEKAVEMWLNSPGHHANMLDPAYRELGVGIATSSGGEKFWVQVFASPMPIIER